MSDQEALLKQTRKISVCLMILRFDSFTFY